jgi:hypothetical protein
MFKRKNKWLIIAIFCIIGAAIGINELLDSESFKSEKVLKASLKDDLSAIHLILRKDNTFEVTVNTLFSDKTFNGNYKLLKDMIVFLDRPYDNDKIPDTVTILKDKIILKFEKNGEPNTDFANYFTIRLNRLQTDSSKSF